MKTQLPLDRLAIAYIHVSCVPFKGVCECLYELCCHVMTIMVITPHGHRGKFENAVSNED